MIDFRLPAILGLSFNFIRHSWIPCTVCMLLVLLIEIIRPGTFNMKKIRIGWCVRTALVVLILIPWACNLAPGGGEEEQRWLDKVIVCLEVSRDACDDPEMKEIIDYTIRRHNRIGPFGVRVVQLPEDVLGVNSPFCPGITLDESLTEYHPTFGAEVLVHEAMHEYWPFFGHSHIDDERIWRHVVRPNCAKPEKP